MRAWPKPSAPPEPPCSRSSIRAAPPSPVWAGNVSSAARPSGPRTSKPTTFAAPTPRFSPSRGLETAMPVILRSATLDDVPAILAIEQQAASAANWPPEEYEKLVRTGVVIVAEQVAEQAAEPVAEQAGHPADAEQTGKLCGFVCAKAVAGEWEIENVVVAGEFLRRGIADRLMQALLDQAEKSAASRIL